MPFITGYRPGAQAAIPQTWFAKQSRGQRPRKRRRLSATERRRDGETERRRDGETERRRDGKEERRKTEGRAERTLEVLELDSLRLDGGTQIRAGIDDAAVAEYAERMANETNLPPPSVFDDGRDQSFGCVSFHRGSATMVAAHILGRLRRCRKGATPTFPRRLFRLHRCG